MFANPEMGDDGDVGRDGPRHKSELLKESDHTKEWRNRYFVLKRRRLYYYENLEDSRPRGTNLMEGFPKGYLDVVGAKIMPFTEEDEEAGDGSLFYGFEIQEEYGIWGGQEAEGDSYRLCTNIASGRDAWVDSLQMAARPQWVSDEDVRAQKDMETGEPFSFFARRHHCRVCGGVFRSETMIHASCPELKYLEAVSTCKPCANKTKHASRWIGKVPKSQRAKKKPALGDEFGAAADTVAEAAATAFNGVSSFFKGFGGAEEAAPTTSSSSSGGGRAARGGEGATTKSGFNAKSFFED